MRKIFFYKYQGTGNDFVIIDQLEDEYDLSTEQIRFLCDRKFGIGGDGLMVLRKNKDHDFTMVYYNSDGNISTMCGNGGRCISHLYFMLKGGNETIFEAIDGLHTAKVEQNNSIALKMNDVEKIDTIGALKIIDTGSPHAIMEVDKVADINVKREGSKIRYSENFIKDGINVNFLERNDGFIKVRTYERGVEDETLSCGTGVTACAIVAGTNLSYNLHSPISVSTKGGELKVSFQNTQDKIVDIWLIGPAVMVYKGNIEI